MRDRRYFGGLIIMLGVLILTCSCAKRREDTAESTVLQEDEGESYVQTEEELISVYEYDYLEPGKIVITAYSGEESLVIVPEKIEGKSVIAIGDKAFYENHSITKVLLSEGIESIGEAAFAKCAYVEYIFLPSTVREIGEGAFANMNRLKELRFPHGIELIASVVCKDCISLESVYFPEGVQIERDSFSGCVQLKLIYGYDEAARNYALEHDYIYVDLNRVEEEGNVTDTWDIYGKTSIVFGREEGDCQVDVNLKFTDYGSTVDGEHAVMNYCNGCWYIEDLDSENGTRIQPMGEEQKYRVSSREPCRVERGDVIYIGQREAGRTDQK